MRNERMILRLFNIHTKLRKQRAVASDISQVTERQSIKTLAGVVHRALRLCQ